MRAHKRPRITSFNKTTNRLINFILSTHFVFYIRSVSFSLEPPELFLRSRAGYENISIVVGDEKALTRSRRYERRTSTTRGPLTCLLLSSDRRDGDSQADDEARPHWHLDRSGTRARTFFTEQRFTETAFQEPATTRRPP